MLFLGAIPGFAVAYLAVAEQFHHSTARFERSVADEADAILDQIETEIIDGYVAKSGSDHLVLDDAFPLYGDQYPGRLHIAGIKAIRLSTRGPTLRVHLRAGMTPIGEPTPVVRGSFGLALAFNANNALARSVSPNGVVTHHTAVRLVRTSVNIPLSKLLPAAASVSGPRSRSGIYPMSAALGERIEGFWAATRGFPSETRGSYLRMLYLSAVTITTLGYGDIVPTGDTARALVGSEAVAGIILIGLFLNSTLQGRPRRRDHDDQCR
ncbi:MAG TPA: potassium channel family protein [Actinomycetota bacterium]|nr:potassium channel family protein [Actinomycetota bacterium]